jgi:photosystem II stability/assembly factor-like uncharacterized protein
VLPRSTVEAAGASLRLVESPAIIDLDMFNEREGWAVTEAEIVRTDDGGLTWYDVTPPGMDETGYGVDAFFLDSGHAWIQKPAYDQFPNSGSLFRTLDGGRTWSEFTAPFSRGDLNFVDEDNGWVLADLGVGAGSNAVAVYRTSSGGANWERIYTNDPNDPDADDSLPLGGIKSDLVPLDADKAWVTGVVYTPGEVYLYRSEDGGSSWTPVALALPPGAEQFELGIDNGQMKFVTGRDGYLAVHMAGNSIQTAVYITHDSGNSWSLTPNLIDGAGASAFLTEQDAIIYNGEEFHVSADGAQSWSVVQPDVLFGESFMDMDFVNPQSGWTITMDPSTNHRSLYRTQDGGKTWHPTVP